METIFVILYVLLSYWAIGQTLYVNYIRIGTVSGLFIKRFILGCLLGIILIPIAVIKKIIRSV